MRLNGKTVLVTGAGGFLGSHLAERLLRDGATVRALVHYNARGSLGWLDYSPLARDMEVIAGDVTDQGCCNAATHGQDLVFHLAALTTVPHSYAAPAAFARTNIDGTLNMLEAVRRQGCARFIQASSSQTYGTARTVPIGEDHPLNAQSPYAATKIAADALVAAWRQSFDVPAVILKVFCTFGPRQSLRNVVPTIIDQLIAGPIVRLGNLGPCRDYNYVDDAIEAYVRAALAPDAVGGTFNICGKTEISIRDLALLVGRIMGQDAQIEVDPARVRPAASEVDRLLGDASHAEKVLGWTHSIELEDGLERTIDWYRQNRAAVTPTLDGVFR